MTSLTSALSSLADSQLGRDLKAAVPAALALGVSSLGPVASTAVSVAAANLTGTTSSISDLGKELSSIGGAVVDAAESVVSGVENSIETAVKKVYGSVENTVSAVLSKVGNVVEGVESAVDTVAPVVFGLGAIINAVI